MRCHVCGFTLAEQDSQCGVCSTPRKSPPAARPRLSLWPSSRKGRLFSLAGAAALAVLATGEMGLLKGIFRSGAGAEEGETQAQMLDLNDQLEFEQTLRDLRARWLRASNELRRNAIVNLSLDLSDRTLGENDCVRWRGRLEALAPKDGGAEFRIVAGSPDFPIAYYGAVPRDSPAYAELSALAPKDPVSFDGAFRNNPGKNPLENAAYEFELDSVRKE